MKTALLLLLFCLAEADDVRWEFQQFKTQLEGQHAALTLEMTQLKADLTLEMTQLKADLTLEMTQLKNDLTLDITQLKSDVNNLKYQCPRRWTKFGGSCYYMGQSDEGKTWQQSRENCQNQGADLVVINSGEEKDFVLDLNDRDKTVWIGLSDRETEGVWKWVDGTPLTTPTYWIRDQPNGGEEADCVGFRNSIFFFPGGWSDHTCGTKLNWICERVF